MNFIGEIKSTDLELELKYCERCGGVFLRLLGTTFVYCSTCMAHWAALQSTSELSDRDRWRSKRKTRKARVPRSNVKVGVSINDLHGIASVKVQPC